MFRNLLAAALRNLAANRLYAGVSITGLSLGLAAAMLTALYIDSELGFDRFVPGHDRIFVVTSKLRTQGQSDIVTDYAPSWLAARIGHEVPQVRRAARLAYDEISIRRGDVEARENIAWVDPAFFEVLPLPALAGDPRRALDDPNGVVITRSMARKYFGRDAPLGKVLRFDGVHSLRVGAVIADLPAETHLTQEIFASGAASFSRLSRLAGSDARRGYMSWLVTPQPDRTPQVRFENVRLRTYLRLDSPGQGQTAARAVADLGKRQGPMTGLPPGATVDLDLVALNTLHLQDFRGANLGVADQRGSRPALLGLAAAAGLVLALAITNFVNLTTARAGRRAVEVGVRKVAGAQRRHLIAQFVGEACLHALVATVLALALVDLILPALNAFLGRGMSFPYWRDPLTLGGLAFGVLALGVLAGAYPAFVMSAFRPASVLKGGPIEASGSGWVRQTLVVFQFVVLIVLILAVSVVWRQTRFAMNDGLRIDKDQMLIVHATPCRGPFQDEVRRLPGVKAAACSSRTMLGLDDFDPTKYVMDASAPGGPLAHTDMGLVDFGLFELYGVRPVAGRLFDPATRSDELAPQVTGTPQRGSVILNEAAARKLGFARPEAALNQLISVGPGYGAFNTVGVVPDFTLDLLNAEVKATVYLVDFANYPADQVLSIKLDGGRIAQTLLAIDRLWKQTGQPGAIRRQFLDDYVGQLYLGVVRQAFLVSVLCGLALLLASLGLLGLAAFTAERRTKEIGVRKAMGATSADILALLIWQFTRPVLVACLIATPVGWWVMRRWLDGFAYRIELTAGMFAAAGLAAVLIAWITVGAHAWTIAQRKPIEALRYE